VARQGKEERNRQSYRRIVLFISHNSVNCVRTVIDIAVKRLEGVVKQAVRRREGRQAQKGRGM
jgi:hypothetical protein